MEKHIIILFKERFRFTLCFISFDSSLSLFVLSNDVFFSFRNKWNSSRFRMHATIMLFLLFFSFDCAMFLLVVVNIFGNLSVLGNSPDLWMSGKFFL